MKFFTSKNLYTFTGQESDSSGFLSYNARYYDPDLGRFLQADTVSDGMNRYAYCGNNPVRYVDPTGNTEIRTYANSPVNSHRGDSKGDADSPSKATSSNNEDEKLKKMTEDAINDREKHRQQMESDKDNDNSKTYTNRDKGGDHDNRQRSDTSVEQDLSSEADPPTRNTPQVNRWIPDFGFDFYQSASRAYGNGEYLKGFGYNVAFLAEAAMDVASGA